MTETSTPSGTLDILPNTCIGAGNCVEQAEEYFDQDDDAIVILLRDHVPAEDYAQVRSAANVCPVAAIRLTPTVQ